MKFVFIYFRNLDCYTHRAFPCQMRELTGNGVGQKKHIIKEEEHLYLPWNDAVHKKGRKLSLLPKYIVFNWEVYH